MCVQESETGLGRRGVDYGCHVAALGQPCQPHRSPRLGPISLNCAKSRGESVYFRRVHPTAWPVCRFWSGLGVILGRGGLFKAAFLVGKHSGYKYAKFDQAPSARL